MMERFNGKTFVPIINDEALSIATNFKSIMDLMKSYFPSDKEDLFLDQFTDLARIACCLLQRRKSDA